MSNHSQPDYNLAFIILGLATLPQACGANELPEVEVVDADGLTEVEQSRGLCGIVTFVTPGTTADFDMDEQARFRVTFEPGGTVLEPKIEPAGSEPFVKWSALFMRHDGISTPLAREAFPVWLGQLDKIEFAVGVESGSPTQIVGVFEVDVVGGCESLYRTNLLFRGGLTNSPSSAGVAGPRCSDASLRCTSFFQRSSFER